MIGKSVFTVAFLGASTLAAEDRFPGDDDRVYLRSRELLNYEAPMWYERMEIEDTTGILRRCMKKQTTPETGHQCGYDEKICYFGTQDCDGVGAHPATKCYCDGATGESQWQCEEEQCPIFPDPARTGCAPEGKEMNHGNSALCPSDSPLGAGSTVCSAEQDKLQCSYGEESCCGQCYADNGCHCNSKYGWSCFFNDQCLLASCRNTDWPLEGLTCLEARTAIFVEYPGMTVVCQKESDPNPDDDDFNRYVVYTNSSGIVTTVVYNRNAACPATKPDSCYVEGQQCSWSSDTASDTTTCTNTEKCTCRFGSFECEKEKSCESAKSDVTKR